MLSTALFNDKAAPGRRPQARPTGTDAVSAAPRRDANEQPQPRPSSEERPLTFDDIARIGDTKADDQDDADGQSSTKGTGSAG
jgi:hypothetical protein